MAKCKQIFILVEQIDMHGWKMDTSSFITCVFLVWLNKIFCFFNKYGKSVHPVCFFWYISLPILLFQRGIGKFIFFKGHAILFGEDNALEKQPKKKSTKVPQSTLKLEFCILSVLYFYLSLPPENTKAFIVWSYHSANINYKKLKIIPILKFARWYIIECLW